MNEVSREIIISEQNSGGDGMPWNNISRFSELVFSETKVRLGKDEGWVFSDRSPLDNIAYLKCAQKETPKELSLFPFHNYYYKRVFYAPSWSDIYEKDEQRLQDFEGHILLSKHLKEVYEFAGFELVELPFSSVENRVEFVLSELEDYF